MLQTVRRYPTLDLLRLVAIGMTILAHRVPWRTIFAYVTFLQMYVPPNFYGVSWL
jgi:hypothetical protein